MLITVTPGELPNFPGMDIRHKDMQPAIVVKAGRSFGKIWFIEIASYHERIAGAVLCFWSILTGDERNFSAVRRPGDDPAGVRLRAVGRLNLRQKPRPSAIWARNDEARLSL